MLILKMNVPISEAQAAADAAMFSGPAPEELARLAKEREKKAKEREKMEKQLKPKQLELAQELTNSMKDEEEAVEKAKLIQKLSDYMKLIANYHPHLLDQFKIPKTGPSPKHSLEQLRIWIHDVESELGKQGGLDILKMLWVNAFKGWEQLNTDQALGLNQRGISIYAENMLMSRRTEKGEIIPGPAIPTLAEFACKHSNWFQTSVEWRLGMMVVEMVATVHKVNSEQPAMQKAQSVPVSKQTKEAMDKL